MEDGGQEDRNTEDRDEGAGEERRKRSGRSRRMEGGGRGRGGRGGGTRRTGRRKRTTRTTRTRGGERAPKAAAARRADCRRWPPAHGGWRPVSGGWRAVAIHAQAGRRCRSAGDRSDGWRAGIAGGKEGIRRPPRRRGARTPSSPAGTPSPCCSTPPRPQGTAPRHAPLVLLLFSPSHTFALTLRLVRSLVLTRALLYVYAFSPAEFRETLSNVANAGQIGPMQSELVQNWVKSARVLPERRPNIFILLTSLLQLLEDILPRVIRE